MQMEIVQDKDLLDLSHKITGEWKNLARHLNIGDAQIYRIENDNDRCTQERIYQMLIAWKKKKGRGATYRVLEEALRQAERKDLADDFSSRQDFRRCTLVLASALTLVIALSLAAVFSPTVISSLTDAVNRIGVHGITYKVEDWVKRDVSVNFSSPAANLTAEGDARRSSLVRKKLFIKQLQEHYKDLYEAIQPVPYNKDAIYSVDSVFTEGGIEFLDSKAQGARKRWVSLKSYKDIFDDPRVKSKRRIIESDPGYGKSTLTLKLSHDWCTRTSVLKDIDILILLRLNQLSGTTSIYSAIRETILPRDSTLNEGDIRDIINECNSLLIIMDEFDKFPDRQNENSDINNIIAKQMLRDAEVIITTRTSVLPITYPPGAKRIRLTGFNDDARRSYIRKAVTIDNEDDARNVEEYLKQYPILYDLCQVTSWFVLFAHTKYETDHGEDFNCTSSYSSQNIDDYLNEFNDSDKLASLCILGLTERTENIKGPIAWLCNDGFVISGHDEPLLQRLHVQLLEIAATKKIPIRMVQLHNCFQSVELATPSIKTTSGLALTSRIPVKKLGINMYNRDMTKEEAIDILQFASMCPSLFRLEFYGSVPPQTFTFDSYLATLKSRAVKVQWKMFKDDPWYILNLETGRWEDEKGGEEPTKAEFDKMESRFTEVAGGKTEVTHEQDVKGMRYRLRKLADELRNTESN